MREHASRVAKQISKKFITLWAAAVLAFSSLAFVSPLLFAGVAKADTPTVIQPSSIGGWSVADTRAGGSVNFINDASAPLGGGALELSTDSTNIAKAQLMLSTNVKLSDITTLSYYAKQVSASSSSGDASYQLAVDLDGNGTFDTTLVYEPYWNGTPSSNTWQQWDAFSGQWWSSKTSGGLTAGSGGAPFYTLSQVLSNDPDATVIGFGVNVGTYNPSYTIEVDSFNFNGTTYDFEPSTTPANVYVDSSYTAINSGGHFYGYDAFSSIQDAIDAVADGGTIVLSSNITVASAVNVNKAITINGQHHHLNAHFARTDSSNNAAIEILHSNVNIQDLVEDGTGSTDLHGINIYASSGVVLDTVTVSNNDHDGIVVNGSSVTVNNINTSSNNWGGIDVDQGSGVTSAAVLTVNGTSTHDELIPILIDDLTKNVSVIDTNHQYSFHDNGNLRIYSLLQSGQSAPDSSGNATANSTTPQVVVSSPSQPVTVTVTPGTNNASVDYSALISGNSGTIPQTTISAPAATVSIPASTTVTASGGTWDGTITAPTTTTVSLGSGKTVATAVEVGADGLHLTFSNAVRLLLPGQANKLVGFVRNGDFTQISNACSADSQAAGDALPADGDCYINAGSDMAIWTKHFTTFVAYSNTTSPSGGGSSTSTGSSSGSTGSSAGSSSSQGVVQGESTTNSGKTSSTNTETPVANLAQPKTAAKEANGGGLRWYWIVLIALAVIGLGVAGVYRYAEGTDRR